MPAIFKAPKNTPKSSDLIDIRKYDTEEETMKKIGAEQDRSRSKDLAASSGGDFMSALGAEGIRRQQEKMTSTVDKQMKYQAAQDRLRAARQKKTASKYKGVR